jgi:DNA-binding transcriptional MerR regulator
VAYTINQLAKLAGVSTRTLRFYDDIALLKPAYYGDNQYRYYQEQQSEIPA